MTWTTFPVARATKRPLVRWGDLAAGEQIPIGHDHDTGAATGSRSGILVIDLDIKNPPINGIEEFAALGETPPTFTVTTRSGGRHIYFEYPDFEIRNTAGALGHGIDVRGEGGYVVIPPSEGYEVECDAPIAPAPAWLLELLRAAKAPGPRPTTPGAKIKEGGRSSALTSLAGTMRRRGMGEAAILAALLEHNKLECDPPLGAREVGRIAKSVDTLYRPVLSLDDFGLAQRFARDHAAKCRFLADAGNWVVFTGTRWERDPTCVRVRELAKTTLRGLDAEVAKAPDDQSRDSLRKFAHRCRTAGAVEATLKMAQSEPGIVAEGGDFDTDPWLFNVANGVLDLRTGTLIEHRATDRVTKQSGVVWDERAESPAFDHFLEECQPDEEVRAYLLRWFGYALTGDVREQAFPIFWGSGANGKSTLLNAIMHVFGTYATTVPTELLTAKRGGDAHPTERTTVLGVRLAAAHEADETRPLAVAQVKALTGGDKIKARFMRGDFFEFSPTHKLVLVTNHRPEIRESQNAIWRRVQLVPWEVSFLGREDRDLERKLFAEASGILRRLVAGYTEWQAKGLAPPARVLAANADYREDEDEIGQFLEECCRFEGGSVTRAELKRAYDDWCARHGNRFPRGPKALAGRLRDLGVKEHKSDGVRKWVGVSIVTTPW